jgi:hypothetical protein
MRHWLGLLCVVGWAAAAWGDGCYFPERAVKKVPDIPSQRALLTWRDGVETLVISSTLDSEAQKLGWIIPLPAVPTTMEKADPGMLKTLAFCVQPWITHDNIRTARRTTIFLAWALGVLWATVFRVKTILDALMLLFLLGVLSVLVFAGIGTAGGMLGQSVLGTSIERTARVGAYDVTVLKAKSPLALNNWLATNQYAALPDNAAGVVAEYIQQGWVFTAIQLARTEPGRNTPHPIKLVFPAAQAVYPWKLTAAVGGAPELELFVVGKERAGLKGLPTEHCERFGVEPAEVKRFSGQWTTIGHPEVMPLLWWGCVLTKLAGKVNSADDLRMEWSEYAPYRQTLYTANGAWGTAWMAGNFVLGGLSVLGVIVFFRRLRLPGGARFYFWNLGCWVAGAVALTVVLTYFCLPKLPAGQFATTRRLYMVGREKEYCDFLGERVRATPGLRAQSEEEIASALLADHWRENPYQGDGMRHESTPGNFTVRKVDGRIRISVYDRSGEPVTQDY